ncbi:hypothetical protein PsAD37_04040 [Pseudovibrio sp. Ad37]|nr:hypothetical protein PsAD37_04040 [Pseudovibrio sp. Ad37]
MIQLVDQQIIAIFYELQIRKRDGTFKANGIKTAGTVDDNIFAKAASNDIGIIVSPSFEPVISDAADQCVITCAAFENIISAIGFDQIVTGFAINYIIAISGVKDVVDLIPIKNVRIIQSQIFGRNKSCQPTSSKRTFWFCCDQSVNGLAVLKILVIVICDLHPT